MNGKDIMTSTYSFDDLVSAYDNFLVPAVAIYTGKGKQNIVNTKGVVIQDIKLVMSAREVSGLTFQVNEVFDESSHKMKGEVVSALAVGTLVEAAFGYGSDLTTVFKGYITEYRTSYQEEPVIMVTAVDFRSLMKKNKRLNYKFQEKSYTEIFKEIVGNYSSFYSEIHVDTVNEKAELIQDGSDYDFINNILCPLAKMDFYVVGTDVYFKKKEKSGSQFLELKWGTSLQSFEKGVRYCNEKVTVYSSMEDKTAGSASATIKTSDNTPQLVSESQVEEWELGRGLDTTALQNWADKRKQEKEDKMETARGSSVGLPEIVPGRYIKITGVDPGDEGLFYIREVCHSFDSERFYTSFTAGKENDGWDVQQQDDASFDRGKNGVFRAVVKENWNEEHKGCVLVEFLSGTEGKKDTRWLPVAQPYCGNGYGMYFLPEIDTEVLVAGQTGDINSLVVLGALWNQVDILPEETAVEKNTIKKIRTKGNHEILFNDDKDKGEIKISTAGGLNIVMSEEGKTINISDADGKNVLLLDGENGNLKLKADKKITLSAGDKDMLVLDSGGGKITLEADHLEEKGTQDFKIQTQKLSVKGEITELKAGGSFKINSSGMTEIKGSMVKIN